MVPNDSARCEITATLKLTQCGFDVSISNIEKMVKDIRRNTRRKFSTEEKIRIVLDGLRGESSIAELCRQEGINPNLYYLAPDDDHGRR